MNEPVTWRESQDALARCDWARARALARGAGPAEDPELEAARLELIGEASWWLGDIEEAIDARQQAFRAYEELGRHRRAGANAVFLYEHHCQRARGAIGSAWLQRARRALADDPDCEEHGALLLREAELAHGSGALDEAEEHAARALVLARTLRCDDLEAEALQTIGRVRIEQGDIRGGLAHLDEAMLLAVEGRLGPYSTGKVYCSLIGACEDVGDLRRAAEWTEATTTWAQQHPLAIFPGICRIHHAVVLDRRGAMARAEAELAQACDELAGSHLANAAAAYAEVGDIRRRLGDLAGAEAAFARVEELTGETCAGVALLRLAQGRVDEAQRTITSCLANGSPNRLGRARLLPAAAQIQVAAGHLERAEAAVRELDATAQDLDTPMLRAAAALARGRVQLAADDVEGACVSLRDAVQRWQALEVPYEVATARTVLAQALREAGDEEGARSCFAAARAQFEEIGARLDTDDPDDPDGAGDHHQPTATPALPDGLTAREAEVLRLVAAGAANKEIAADLGLSVKTVSRHLSNIFTKIGVSSRSAATAYAFEQHLVGDQR